MIFVLPFEPHTNIQVILNYYTIKKIAIIKKIKTAKSPFFISTYDLTVSNFNITSFETLNTASSESYLIPFSSRGN